MKKIFTGLLVLAVSACTYLKGDYTLGRRNTFNDFFYTYNIRYYDLDEFATSAVETETVSDYEKGVVRRAVPGGIVVSSKIMQKEVYYDIFVRPDKKGLMTSYTVPVQFSDEKVYKTIGETKIDGKTYRLLEPSRIGDVVLIDEKGKIYPRVGRIYNDRLALLSTSFLLEPEEITFVSETNKQFGEDDVISGFEVRYAGVENYRMVFKYSQVHSDNGMAVEDDKTYSFPMYDKNVSFEGISLEILNIDEGGIEYKLLEI